MALCTETSYNESEKTSQHPFGVETSSCRRSRGSESCKFATHGKINLGDSENSVTKNVNKDKRVGNLKSFKTDIFLSVLLVITAGSLATLIWHILHTDEAFGKILTKIGHLEKQITADSSTLGFVQKELSSIAEIGIKQMTTEQHSIKTTMPSSSTSSSAAATTFYSPTTVAEPTGFQVLQVKETEYKNYNFLAVQVRVPTDGLSVSENWCRDYENLCKQFGRRPTGCGNDQSSPMFTSCFTQYNSFMDAGGLLGCSSSETVAVIVDQAFSELSQSACPNHNSFGFYRCDADHCANTIRQSEYGLHSMKAFWEYNITTMYTLCH